MKHSYVPPPMVFSLPYITHRKTALRARVDVDMALRCNWFARLPVTQEVAGSNPVWVAIKGTNHPLEKKLSLVILRWKTFGEQINKMPRVRYVWLKDNSTHSSKYKHNRAVNPCVIF